MSLDLLWWGRLAGLLAVEASLVVAMAWLTARWLRSPQMQRAVWQAALLGIALLWVAELAGARGQLARWLPAEPPRRMLSIRVLDAPRTEAVTGPFLVEPAEAPLPTVTPPRLVWWPGWLWLTGFTLLTGRLALSRAWLMWCVWRSHGGDLGVGRRASVLECVRLAAAFVRRTCLRGSIAPVRSRKAVSPLRSATALQDAGAHFPAPADITAIIEPLRRQLGLRRVRLLVWPRLRGPVAFGVLRPTVALPEDFRTRFSPAQCEAMLAHELAHLAARDPLWLTWADLVCALAWWHPAVWWARRQLRSACESAADEAAALVPDGRATLAESLVTFGRELASPRWARGIGVAGDGLKSQLARRVKVLLHASGGWCAVRPARMWATRLGAAGGVAALVLAPWPGVNGAGLAPLLAAVKTTEPTTSKAQISTITSSEGTESSPEPALSGRAIDATTKVFGTDPTLPRVVEQTWPNGNITIHPLAPTGNPAKSLTRPTRMGAFLMEMTNRFGDERGMSYELPKLTYQTGISAGGATLPSKSVYVPLRPSDGAEPAPIPVQTDKTRQLHSRRFDLPAKEFTGHLTRFLPQLGTRNRVNDWNRAVRGFFLIHGVEFSSATDSNTGTSSTPQEEKALFFNDRTGVLFLHATLEDLDRVELAIQSLNLPVVAKPPDATPPLGPSVGERAAAGRLPTQAMITGGSTGNDLRAREFRLSVVGLDQTFRDHLLHFLPSGETDLKRHLQSAVRSFCYVNGVEVPSATVVNLWSANANGPTATPTPDQKSAFFNDDTGVLFVRATATELMRIESAIQSLHLQPELADALLWKPWDVFERTKLEANLQSSEGRIAELRTRYKGGHPKGVQVLAVRTELQAQLLASKVATQDAPPPKATIAPPQIEFEVHFAEITERSSDDLGLDWLFGQSPTNNPAVQSGPATNLLTEAGSPSGQNLRVDLLRTEGQSARLTTTQFAALKKRLEGRGGVEFLAAPKLITQSGRQARIAVSDIRTIVSGVGTSQGSATNQARIGYQTEQIATGPSVDLVGTLEGDATRLAIVAKVTEFLGYDQPKPGQEVQAASPDGKPVKGVMPLPHLRVRSTQADVSAAAGETVVLRGPLVSDTQRWKDTTVGWGELPVIGRFFRKEGTMVVRKRLYVFVTPSRISATGEKQ